MPDLSTQLRDYFDATASPLEVDEVVGDVVWVPARRTPPKRRTTANWAYGIAATFVVLALIVGVALLLPGGNENEVADSTPPGGPESSLLGTWVASEPDGSNLTMIIEVSEERTVEMLSEDNHASVCSGTSSTMTGTGRLESDTVVVIPTPLFTCDDGAETQALSGPPLEEQLQNLTFNYDPENDTLIDNFGLVWSREGSERPNPDPTATGWWPQTNLEEVREAQELADAGDPDYTWQLDTTLAADGEPWGAEIFTRFIEEELGWEEFSGASFAGYMYADGGGSYESVLFIRCAPGQTNPLSALYAEAPPEIRRCAPTIDELSYETVGISVNQPGVRGPSGIWVVTRWETFQSRSDSDPRDLLHPDFLAERQVEQVLPPSDAEVTALLEAFLRARVDGEEAEQYLLRESEKSPFEDVSVPLLYATTSGAPYERSEIEKVQGPVWPTGWMEYKLRLFAEGGTVVEQLFHVVRHDGQLGLVYGDADIPTTENGQSVPLPYSILDGAVTFTAAPPWQKTDSPSDTFMRFNGSRDDHVVISTDLPMGTDCDPAPADAEALARRIMAEPNIDTTGTVPVRIAGLDGLQMDVDVDDAVFRAEEDHSCRWIWGPDQADRWRMRLYLVDLPEDMPMQTLAIAVIAAPDTDFERVLEEATPIVESLEIHTR